MNKTFEKIGVDLKRLENSHQEMLRQFEQFKAGFVDVEKACDQFNQYAQDLVSDDVFNDEFNQIEISFQKFEKLLGEISDLQSSYSSEFGNIESRFEKLMTKVSDLNAKKYLNSSILSCSETNELIKLMNFTRNTGWELLYCGKRDGFKARDFHSHCDSKFPTLTIIKSRNGNIFGGYTEASWSSDWASKEDSNTFIFSLKNKLSTPMKCFYSKPTEYVLKLPVKKVNIKCSPVHGPIFGDNDIVIAFDANSNENVSKLGTNVWFHHNDLDKNNQKSFLAGSENFRVSDIQVFKKTLHNQ